MFKKFGGGNLSIYRRLQRFWPKPNSIMLRMKAGYSSEPRTPSREPVTNFFHLHLPSVKRWLFCFLNSYPVQFETKFCGASLMGNPHLLFSVQYAAYVASCCGCRSWRNVSHYTAPSRFYTNTPQSVIVENPGGTANEMKLWIFKLFHSLQFNNEQLLESWSTEFPFCERAKRRWRVEAGNGKQTLHILHLLRSLVVCRLKQVCLQNGCMSEVVFAFWYAYGDPCDPWSV